MIKKRLNKKEIANIKKLVKSGSSLNKISKLTNKSKTTVYYYFRKFKGRTISPIKINTKNKEFVGEFIGLFAGDGCMYKTKDYNYRTYLHFNKTEKKFVEDLIGKVLVKLFEKEPMIFKPGNRLNLCYCSKGIHQFISEYLVWDQNYRKTYSVRLKEGKYGKQFIIGFIRGSLDSDGYFSKNKISFATVSPGLKKNIIEFLDILSITHTVRLYKEKRKNRKGIYHITVWKKDHNKFINLIKPRNKWD